MEAQVKIHAATERTAVAVDLSGVEFLASIETRTPTANAKVLNGRGGQLVLYKPQSVIV